VFIGILLVKLIKMVVPCFTFNSGPGIWLLYAKALRTTSLPSSFHVVGAAVIEKTEPFSRVYPCIDPTRVFSLVQAVINNSKNDKRVIAYMLLLVLSVFIV